jgi:threonine dehydratase
VYDVAIETPLELAPKLSEKIGAIGAQIHLKREDMQPASTILLHYLFRVLLLS